MKLPSRPQIKQLESVVANPLSRFFLLAACLWWGGLPAFAIRSNPLETRVGGCGVRASGQTSMVSAQSLENTMGLAGYGYKTASGRQEWLNQDPIGLRGGINLFAYVGNNPINYFDPLGLYIFPEGYIGPIQPGDSIMGNGWIKTMQVDGHFQGSDIETGENAGLQGSLLGELLLPGGGIFMSPARGFRVCAAKTAGKFTPDALTEAARAAMGKGPNALPGSPLTSEMVQGLQRNLGAAESQLANNLKGLSTSGTQLSAEAAARQAALAQQRIDLINQILKSGVQAPKN